VHLDKIFTTVISVEI